jgi:dTDP-4-dehydrorhamnose 3,5-epimerase
MKKIYGKMLPGIQVVSRLQHIDDRGYFCETWKIKDDGMRGTYRQLNTAVSGQYVVRGMHRQNQYKLVMPVHGKIFDVVLQPEDGRWFAIELDSMTGLLIPPEYAHGYMALTDNAVVQYIVDMPYDKEIEENFKWNEYNIQWPTHIRPILSEKDR